MIIVSDDACYPVGLPDSSELLSSSDCVVAAVSVNYILIVLMHAVLIVFTLDAVVGAGNEHGRSHPEFA